MDTLGVVPEEVVDHIVSFLNAPALLACELVCRQWCRIARVSPAWRRIAQAMSMDGVPQPSFPADAYPLGWKQLYLDGNNLARLGLLQGEVDLARLQLDEDVLPLGPQVQVGGVTLSLSPVWREAESSEDSKLTFYLELPQAQDMPPSATKDFFPHVGFIMGFEPTNQDAPLDRFALTTQFQADRLTWGWEELIAMHALRRLGWLWEGNVVKVFGLLVLLPHQPTKLDRLKIFMSGMRYGQGKIRALCVDYIGVLTCRATKQQPRIRSYFRAHQGIPMTLALLQGSDPEAQLAAATLCQALAFNDFSSCYALLHHGAIPVLLKALDCPNINVRRNAAGTLLNLQQCHQTSRKICEADGVRLTVNLFRDCPAFHVVLQQELAGVMCNVAVSDREGAHELTSTDAIELLVAKLTTTTADTNNVTEEDLTVLQLNSALALRSVVLNSKRVEAADMSECLEVPTAGFVALRKHVDQLLEVYREPVVSAKHSSAGAALCALAHFDARCRQAIADLSHCSLALRWIAGNPDSHDGDLCESVLVLLQSVTEANEECRQALLQLAPLETPKTEDGAEEQQHSAAVQVKVSDYDDSSTSRWVIKDLLALIENSQSPNVKWFASRCLFALTFNEERASRCLLDLDGASRVISLLRLDADSLAHQELCWTLANVFHCARRGGQQPTMGEDDISLFGQLVQSDTVKLATRFAAVAILASVLPAVATEGRGSPGSVLPELLAQLRAVSNVEVQFYAAWALAITSQVQPEWLHAQLRAASAADESLGGDLRRTMSAVGASVHRFHRHAGQQALAVLAQSAFI